MARSSTKDPLEKFRFKLGWSDTNGSEPTSLTRAGFHDVQMPKRSTNKIMYREGTDPDISSISAGLSSMEDITMSRGLIANDSNNELYKWASAVHAPLSPDGAFDRTINHNAPPALEGQKELYRKDVDVVMFNRSGEQVRAWRLYNAFPINFVPGSDMSSDDDGEKSLEQLTLGYEDFEELQVAGGELTNNARSESGQA